MLNFIVSTETFIFSDLPHRLMIHDSLTHLTHKTSVLPNERYKTDRKDLDGGSIQLSATVNDILTDPPKYQKYKQDLAKYAWEQAQIFGYGGTLGQFLTALG